MSSIDSKVWPPPPQVPDITELPKPVKRKRSAIILSWLPIFPSASGSFEFWRLDWFDGDAGKISMAGFVLACSVGLCCAAMMLGGFMGYRNRSQWAGKLALAVPIASAVMFLPYILYLYKWKDLQ